MFARLPMRYSRAALKRPFPRATGLALIDFLKTLDHEAINRLFGTGFAGVVATDLTDGVRILFSNGDVVHFRP
jgi:hypothetical protein